MFIDTLKPIRVPGKAAHQTLNFEGHMVTGICYYIPAIGGEDEYKFIPEEDIDNIFPELFNENGQPKQVGFKGANDFYTSKSGLYQINIK